MTSVTELKRQAIGGRGKHSNPRLYIAEHDGALYATNSYWLVPAERMRPLLANYNLEVAAGTFSLNGTVAPFDMEPPNLGAIMPRVDECQVIEPVMVAGRPAYVQSGEKNGWLALFDHEGTTVAFNEAFLAFIVEEVKANETITYRQERPGKALVVTAKARSIMAKEKDGPERFVGLLMPVRL